MSLLDAGGGVVLDWDESNFLAKGRCIFCGSNVLPRRVDENNGHEDQKESSCSALCESRSCNEKFGARFGHISRNNTTVMLKMLRGQTGEKILYFYGFMGMTALSALFFLFAVFDFAVKPLFYSLSFT